MWKHRSQGTRRKTPFWVEGAFKFLLFGNKGPLDRTDLISKPNWTLSHETLVQYIIYLGSWIVCYHGPDLQVFIPIKHRNSWFHEEESTTAISCCRVLAGNLLSHGSVWHIAAMRIVLHSTFFHKLPKKAQMRENKAEIPKRVTHDWNSSWLPGRGWRAFLLSASHKACLRGKQNKTLLLDTLITNSDPIDFCVFAFRSKRNTLFRCSPGHIEKDVSTSR